MRTLCSSPALLGTSVAVSDQKPWILLRSFDDTSSPPGLRLREDWQETTKLSYETLLTMFPLCFLLKYSVPYRNRTRSGGQRIAGHESDVVGSNLYVIK